MYRLTRGFGAYSQPPASIQTILQNASTSSGVPLPILQALAYQESSYNPAAVSPKGAQGLLQLMPATGASLGVTNPLDPQQNANAGASYLASLYAQFGNWNDALVAYNEGPGAFQKSGAYASSQQYADTILANAGFSPSQTITPSSGIDSTASGGVDISTSSSGSSGFDPLVLWGLALGVVGLIAYFA